jgi:GTPase SAR1 family protein
VILAFDLSKAKSFEGLDKWVSEVEKYGSHHIVKMLVGTKSDLKRATEYDAADVSYHHVSRVDIARLLLPLKIWTMWKRRRKMIIKWKRLLKCWSRRFYTTKSRNFMDS